MRVLSLSIFFFFLQLFCTNMRKVAVQPSLQYKQSDQGFKKTNNFWSKNRTKTYYEELMEEGSNRILKNQHSEEKLALQVKSLCRRHAHKCCLCKVYKLDIFQTNVTPVRWENRVTETGHIITLTGQTQSCPCLQL